MAQTTIAEPQDFTPAYNPVKFIIDSTNNNLDGFKYIFDVYDGATLLGRFKVLPTYGTGYGEIDLSRFLNTYLSWNFEPTITTDYDATNCFKAFDVKVGEQYLAQFNYTSALTNSGGFVRVNVSNTFVVGDQINIVQSDGGTANPLVEGLHSVTAATASYFEIGVSWTSVTDANIDGSVTYADNRSVATYDITTLSKQVFNGAVRWASFPQYNETDYTLNGVTKLWLTNQPQTDFYATLGQDIWLNAKVKPTKRIYFENSNGDVLSKLVLTTGNVVGVAVGPNNAGILTAISGTLPLIKPDTIYYDVYYFDGGQKSVKYRVNLDRRVLINEYDLVFLDRMGSMSSFAFQLKSYERGEVQRDEYNQDVTGYVSGGEWKYNYEEFGFKTFGITATKTLELNTNWMSENMAQYFEELVTSPQVFLKLVTYLTTEDGLPVLDENGCPVRVPQSSNYIPVIVTNPSYEIFKERNKHLIKQTLVVKLANNDAING